MSVMSEPKPAWKIWLETDEGYVFGPGVYSILKAVKKKGTLKEASQSLGMSYRYAWGLIKETEAKLGASLIKAAKGGRHGGGSSKITELGEQFIQEFEELLQAWDAFRVKYMKAVPVKATVICLDGEKALRVDEPVYLPPSVDLEEGECVPVRVLLD